MLRVKGLTKNFGGLTAVNNVTFDLEDAGITGLVGPNGSGKTTLFHLVSGFYQADVGAVFFREKPIHHLKPYQISSLGLIRTFQHTRVLPFLSVVDNLMMAAPGQSGENIAHVFFRPERVRREEQAIREQAVKVLELLKLSHLSDQPADRLSYGQEKLVELGRVLMADPKLVLLDEPTAGVNPTLIREITEVVRDLREEQIRFFLVEHNMPLVADLCERVLVMDAGALIFDGRPDEARKNAAVIEAYLGKMDAA